MKGLVGALLVTLCLRSYLSVSSGLPTEVVAGGMGASKLALDHGGVVVEVLPNIGHDLPPVLHVVVFGAGEEEAEAAVVAAAVPADVLQGVTGELK